MIKISWEEYLADIDILVEKIKALDKKKILVGVYGIPRGGLIPAIIISHRLNIPLMSHTGLGILVIDDISDSGKTFFNMATQNFHSMGLTCSLYVRKTSRFYPELYVKQIDSDDWLVFPYEETSSDDENKLKEEHKLKH